jgi:hypothetical protein
MERFISDDRGYLRWVGRNPQGFIVNCLRNPSPTYLMLHRATCHTISGTPTAGRYWTEQYIKVCSLNRSELEAWAQQMGGQLQACRFCNP